MPAEGPHMAVDDSRLPKFGNVVELLSGTP
jgi:hypothetical protein